MRTPDNAKQKAASTYNAAADFYDHPVNSFWEETGRRTVTRLGLGAGTKVFDVCCGSGASALPAADAVSPDGFALRVDLALNLLLLIGFKTQERGLETIEFRPVDML